MERELKNHIDGIGIGSECVSVDPDNGTLTVLNLKFNSRDSFSFFASIEDDYKRIEGMKRVIEVGVSVINKVKLTTDSEFFSRRTQEIVSAFSEKIEEMQSSILQQVEKNFDPAEADSYSKKLTDFFESNTEEFNEEVIQWRKEMSEEQKNLAETIERHFDEEKASSSISKIKNLISVFEDTVSKKFDPNVKTSVISLIEDLLDKRISVTDESSGLFKFMEKVKSEIANLREHVTRLVSQREGAEEVVNNSIHKGPIFQTVVKQKLEEIARPFSDLVEDVTVKEESDKAKKGDFNYDVNERSFRLVIEAKDTKVTSLPETLRILEKSIANRSGHFGIFVVAEEEQLPKQVGLLNIYGDKIVTCEANLEVAVKIAKAYLCMRNASIEGVDGEKIRLILEAIQTSCRQLSMIRRESNVIKKSGARIESYAEQVELEIKQALTEIEEEIKRKDMEEKSQRS